MLSVYKGIRVYGLGLRASSCEELSIHAPMAPPHFQGSVGGGASCPSSHRSWAFFKIPTHCETAQATTQFFLLGFRATPSIPTSKRSSSRFWFQVNIMTGPGQGPPESEASKSQGPPKTSKSACVFSLLGGFLGWLPLASRPLAQEFAADRGRTSPRPA